MCLCFSLCSQIVLFNLDKNNLLDEIHNLYLKFERSPIDTERRKIKNLFYDRYEELAKALEELRSQVSAEER
jgi:hypothetical protein